jgi:hypothetical protein
MDQHPRASISEFVRLLDGAVEVGANDVPIEITDNEQWWIQQRFAITE